MEKDTEYIKGEGKIIMQWQAPEYIKHEKNKNWYIIAGAVAIFATVWAIISGTWSLAAAIVVFAVVYEYIQRYHPPKIISVKVKENGVKVGHVFYNYSDILAFWIIYNHGVKTLNLRVAKTVLSEIIVQLNDQDPVELRHYLMKQILEIEGKNEKLSDVILRLLKL
jgi:uncharacterized membrane protein YobD (UPF0266 family)